MKSKGTIFLFIWLLVCMSLLTPQTTATKQSPQSGKNQFRYYRIDSVKTIVGEITAVKKERSFHKKEFTVLYLKEKKTGTTYRVEVAPQWFFNLDLVTGSRIEVKGSFSRANGMNQIMTRSITFQGQNHHFRDSSGFPMWRGKKRFNKYRRRGRGKGPGRGKGKGRGSTGTRGMR